MVYRPGVYFGVLYVFFFLKQKAANGVGLGLGFKRGLFRFVPPFRGGVHWSTLAKMKGGGRPRKDGSNE